MPISDFGLLPKAHPAFYIPQPHHSLDDLLLLAYGIVRGMEPQYSIMKEYLLALNPEIWSSDMRFGNYIPRTLDFISYSPLDILCLNPEVVKQRINLWLHSPSMYAPIDEARRHVPDDEAARLMFEFLARVSNDTEHVTDFAGVGLGVLGHLSGPENQLIIKELNFLQEQRFAGKLGRKAYQYEQKKILNEYLKKIGWIGRHMHGGEDAWNNLYQGKSRGKSRGIKPSTVFVEHAARMAKLSKLSSRGGILLTGFGMAASCSKIAIAETQEEKNEILLVDGAGLVGGAMGSVVTSIAVGLVFASGPIGWGVALIASAVAGYYATEAGKKVGKIVFDQQGNKLDLVSDSGIGELCRV